MTFEEAVARLEALHWSVWNLGRRSDGKWGAMLYNTRTTSHGANGDSFSARGEGATAAEALLACLQGPGRDTLFDAPVKAVEQPWATLTPPKVTTLSPATEKALAALHCRLAAALEAALT